MEYILFRANRRPDPGGRNYWFEKDMETLVRLARAQATTRQIAYELKRTPQAIRLKASRMGLALTAHAARRSARRAARQGSDEKRPPSPPAEVSPVAGRRTLRITVDFDLSVLTREEKRALAARILTEEELAAEVRMPKAYAPVGAALERNARRREVRDAKWKELGWKWGPLDSEAGSGRELSRRERRRRKRLGILPETKRGRTQ